MANQPLFRTAIIEADFLNKILIKGGDVYEAGQTISPKKFDVPADILERFLSEQVDPYWHDKNDILEYVIIYNDGTYQSQRKRIRYDFESQSNFWSTYSFNGASKDQVESLKNKLIDFVDVISEYKVAQYESVLEKVDENVIFFDQRWLKKFREKQMMLSASDWRVLPDVEDSYPGEKDMWIKWRSTMRSETVKKPQEFDTNLKFLQYLYEHKWPIDPKRYWESYPEGEVEYLSTPDQWVKYDSEAATDFVDSRLVNILNTSGVFKESLRDIRKSVYDLLKDLRMDDFAEINYNQYNVVE